MDQEIHTLTVSAEQAGRRLDKWLSAMLPQLSRSRLQALLEQGCVHPPLDAAHKVRAGEEFRVTIPPVAPTHITAQDIPLAIVYEDEDMLILNKPPGLTVHPAPGHADGTLVNALLAHCGASLSGIGGVARPGIVHRIDKDTSGLLAVAKNDTAHAHLSAQLARRTLKRSYAAIVWGAPAPGRGAIEGAIGRSPKNRQKMAVLAHGGKEARTHYRVEKIFTFKEKPLASLVECTLETGRTHQIRVHMAHVGHSLIGDPLYGRAPAGAPAFARAFPRQALHAKRLEVVHPRKQEIMAFTAPLPQDMQALLEACEDIASQQK